MVVARAVAVGARCASTIVDVIASEGCGQLARALPGAVPHTPSRILPLRCPTVRTATLARRSRRPAYGRPPPPPLRRGVRHTGCATVGAPCSPPRWRLAVHAPRRVARCTRRPPRRCGAVRGASGAALMSSPPPRPRSAMGHRRALDEVELSSDSDDENDNISQQPVYPAPRNAAAAGADDTLQLGCWDGNVLAELDDFLGVLDKEEADEAEGESSDHHSRELSSRDSSKRKQAGGGTTIDEDAPFGFGATSAVDESVIPSVEESAIIQAGMDESVMPTVDESAIAVVPEDDDAAPRMPCPPPAKRQKPASGPQETSAVPPHRMRSHRRPHSQLSGSSVSSSRSSHYSTRGSSMFSSGRLSRASTFNGSAASVASNPFDEPYVRGYCCFCLCRVRLRGTSN